MTHSRLEELAYKDGKFVRVRDGRTVRPKPYGGPIGILLPWSGTDESAYVELSDIKGKVGRVVGIYRRERSKDRLVAALHEGETLGLLDGDIRELENLAKRLARRLPVNAYSATITVPNGNQFSRNVANHLLIYAIQFYRI